MTAPSANLDRDTVAGFGEEWQRFDQRGLDDGEARALFERYFHVFPWERLAPGAVGFDMGAGSGRWARFVADRGYTLHLVDASPRALDVARTNACTSAPSSTSASVRCEPMKPSAPVTSVVRPA